MIHDATRGVRVNHRIRCRAKIRAPGAREKKQPLREMMEARQVAFSVVGDISKAHRRFKHREEEHGCLGCQIDASEEIPVIRILEPSESPVLLLVDQDFGSRDTCYTPFARPRVHAGWAPREGGFRQATAICCC